MHNFYKGSRWDNWETPDSIFKELHRLYHFRLDLAADFVNSKCEKYFDYQDNSLQKNWSKEKGVHWLNPPYSKAEEFFSKAAKEKNRMIAIYKAANLETRLWQDVILRNADWICFIKGRVNYVNDAGEISNGITFGSALIGYRVPCYFEVETLGVTWELK